TEVNQWNLNPNPLTFFRQKNAMVFQDQFIEIKFILLKSRSYFGLPRKQGNGSWINTLGQKTYGPFNWIGRILLACRKNNALCLCRSLLCPCKGLIFLSLTSRINRNV